MQPSDDATDAHWYRDAVFYELHVRAFADSNGDGIGDFPGLLGKLDYLRDLGVTAIWLLPFFPSPLHDDGYDIADYTAVHPAYGTLDDVRAFLDAAHRRGLRVIIELVLNHTSDQHPWFQRARKAPKGSTERNFYVWSETPEKYREARVIFRDYEQSNWSWDPVADAWFWHRFYSHQPDLNYENPAVREAIFDVVDFWLALGVDGLRLDAVPYLAEGEGTTSENLPATHAFLKELRSRIDAAYEHRMLLAEANQWPEDAVAYFGDGDECQMAFHFPLMPRLFMALRTEDRLPVIDIMEQTPALPEGCQWALFLRNHDELTLEMVTEEERLYMYRAYAPAEESRINLGIRHRLAPLLGNSRRRIELMNALLCSLPGTPVIYYGDEIGMGDNIYLGDRDGVRTPMQWGPDRNAGFSAAPPQRLYLPLITDYEYHHEAVHVEAQAQNSHSLLAYMKRLLGLRKRHRAFGRGDVTFLQPANRRILAFIRRHEEETILVVANLSRFGQAVELDLADYAGRTPVELFGRTPFWPIDEQPYRLTLGPHAFSWFTLEPVADPAHGAERQATFPVLEVTGAWTELLAAGSRRALEEALLGFLGDQPWFRGETRSVLDIRILDTIPLPGDDPTTALAPTLVTYADRDPETCLLAFQFAPLPTPREAPATAVIAHVRSPDAGEAVLLDAIAANTIHNALAWLASDAETPLPGEAGELRLVTTATGAPMIQHATTLVGTAAPSDPAPDGRVLMVKFLRRLSEGISPEWEIGAALTKRGFPSTPTVVGALEYHQRQQGGITLAVLQHYVPHTGDARAWAMEMLTAALDAAGEQGLDQADDGAARAADLLAAAGSGSDATTPAADALPFARRIGKRLANLHTTLGEIDDHDAFEPEPLTAHAQRSIYQSMRSVTARALRSLAEALPELDERERVLADQVLGSRSRLEASLATVLAQPLTGVRFRIHGDFHLGQILRTNGDLTIADFEGNADRYLDERRLKESPLRDVAGFLYSLRFAVAIASSRRATGSDRAEPGARVESLFAAWYRQVGAAFLDAWRTNIADRLLPTTEEELVTLVDAFLLEKAISQVAWRLEGTRQGLDLALGIVLDLAAEPAGPA